MKYGQDKREVVVKLENVSKIYRLYDKPSDRLKESLLPFKKRYSRDFYALKDINLTVRRGDTVGFIGRNGAGKSTILKIITGVLTPSAGTVEVHGRIASLLELGAGFNPEMSGIENIYMNGTIMGLTREQMDERLEEIVDFADIGDFIRQPVKMYSSGMFARVAFAVNAFVEPDILIVDEALSVGDAFFQAKCIHKMKMLLDSGVTVLFVSHDWEAVKNLCRRGVLMDKGEIKLDSSANKAVEEYRSLQLTARRRMLAAEEAQHQALADLSSGTAVARTDVPHDDRWNDFFAANTGFLKHAAYQRFQNNKASFVNVMLLDEREQPLISATYGQKVILRMALEVIEPIDLFGTGYHIRNDDGMDLVYSDSAIEDGAGVIENALPGERYVVDWQFRLWLREGSYNIAAVMSIPIDLSLAEVDCCDFVPCAAQFTIRHTDLPFGGYVHWPSTVTAQKA